MTPSWLPRLLCLLLLAWATPALARGSVGFQRIGVPNGDEPPLAAAVWYPTNARAKPEPLETFAQEVATDAPIAGRGLPLVVISHGGGGSLAGHYDTALALARAGFVVAALSHAGDTHGDEGRVLELWRRPVQLRRLVDYMLSGWRDATAIDGRRVGAFGFSNGGFTVLVAGGAVPTLTRIDTYCGMQPRHDLCAALWSAGVESVRAIPEPPDAWAADPRIRAIAVAAPGFGFTFGRDGLANVRIPVALWRGDLDDHQPEPWYDEAVRIGLPRPPEYHLVPGATHYDFLAPCSPILARDVPAICTEIGTFDRIKFHQKFNAQLIAFFRRSLR